MALRVNARAPDVSVNDIDFAVRQLTKCNCLRILQIDFAISSATLLEFLRRCPELELIFVKDILNASNEDEKIAIAKSIGQHCRREFVFRLAYPYYESPEVRWTADTIKDVLNRISKERGFTVGIEYGNMTVNFSDF